MNVLFLIPYPLSEAPSQRFRFEHFFKNMKEMGLSYDVKSFLTPQSWKNLYRGSKIKRGLGIVNGFVSRIGHVAAAIKYDLIFIHREVAPLGPPVFEWFIAKILRKKIIYDFDDAIWQADPNEKNKLWQLIKWKSKVKWICQWSWKVSAGNEYLAAFARQYCDRVEVLPTVVDTKVHRPKPISEEPSAAGPAKTETGITIGWTGSHTTLQYLYPLLPLLKELEEKYKTHFLVIANKDPAFELKNYHFIKWSQGKEVEDLWEIDVGIMPLTDDLWSKGKCGFKAIQYSAIGIPAVVSPVGVNPEIVINEKTGLVCSSQEEWRSGMIRLITSHNLRSRFGENGQKHVKHMYSTEFLKTQFLSLFDAEGE